MHQYCSGKNLWINASESLKYILDTLDDSIINQTDVYIMIPKVIPLDPSQNIKELELEHLPLNELRNKIILKWN